MSGERKPTPLHGGFVLLPGGNGGWIMHDIAQLKKCRIDKADGDYQPIGVFSDAADLADFINDKLDTGPG